MDKVFMTSDCLLITKDAGMEELKEYLVTSLEELRTKHA
jgi:hypothetical protein